MNTRVAKELLHLRDWLEHAASIVARGEEVYQRDQDLREASDSLMMKVGEGVRRLERLGLPAPAGMDWGQAIANRNFIIHQYDEVDRAVTWVTLSADLMDWRARLAHLIHEAEQVLESDGRSR